MLLTHALFYKGSKISSVYTAFDLFRGSTRDVVANLLDCDIVVSEFKLQSCYYIHFRTNTLGKGMNPLILPVLREG